MLTSEYIQVLLEIIGIYEENAVLKQLMRLCMEAHVSFENDEINVVAKEKAGAAEIAGLKKGLTDAAGTIKQMPVATLFREINKAVEAYEKVGINLIQKGVDGTFITTMVRGLQNLEASYEKFIHTRSPDNTANLLRTGSTVYWLMGAARQLIGLGFSSLAPKTEKGDNEDGLELLLPARLNLNDVVEKLAAVSALYEELCALLNVSPAEYPLRVAKIESGSLWLKIFGESKVVALLTKLVESGAGFIYRNFTTEGKIRDIPKQVEVIDSALGLTKRLEELGVDTSQMKENLQKSSIVIADRINTLLSGSPSITVNQETYSIHKELERMILAEGKQLLLEEGEAGEKVGEEVSGDKTPPEPGA